MAIKCWKNVEIEAHQVPSKLEFRNSYLLRNFPLFAIDYIISNNKLYAFDFNTAPGTRHTGIDNLLSASDIYNEIQAFLLKERKEYQYFNCFKFMKNSLNINE